jgi:hypothetical protein
MAYLLIRPGAARPPGLGLIASRQRSSGRKPGSSGHDPCEGMAACGSHAARLTAAAISFFAGSNRPSPERPGRPVSELPATVDGRFAEQFAAASMAPPPRKLRLRKILCPRWESNPHWRRFELRASADWATGTSAEIAYLVAFPVATPYPPCRDAPRLRTRQRATSRRAVPKTRPRSTVGGAGALPCRSCGNKELGQCPRRRLAPRAHVC